tara:strand:+ start:170378 stop:171220 length:843 start_codon:yes stop_codon:yes gene_type:complete
MISPDLSLSGRVIAVPENRQLLLMTEMLRKRGAMVVPVPLVSIHDVPDPKPVLKWLEDFISKPPDIFILLTGEGLRRLLSLAEKYQLDAGFIEALARSEKLCRGPKPFQALREIGLERELEAVTPTTDGVIASLQSMDINGLNIAVQLYGEDPNIKLISYLQQRGAIVSPVAPYVYANQLEESKVVDLIQTMALDEIDVIAFTSQAQVHRLFKVASQHQLEKSLMAGLSNTFVAAVGPVVRDMLEEQGIRVSIMPERTYFMKPLVSAIAEFLNTQAEKEL